MGYRIDYLPVKKIRGAEKNRSSLLSLTAIWFLVFAVLVNLYWPHGKTILRRIVFLGNTEKAEVLVDSPAGNIGLGDKVYQVFSLFGSLFQQYENAN